jgi:hypothetical protein
MPQVNFVNTRRGINIVRGMPTPKRITELRYWLRGAQGVIQEIPRVIAEAQSMAIRSPGQDGWFVQHSEVSREWIRFDLENHFGERSQVVIQRKGGSF